jgi:nucleotide-binding universal stress UspA family protein
VSDLVLTPLDGSALAERALPYAVALARTRRDRLVLLRVLEPVPPRGKPLIQESSAKDDLERVAAPIRVEGLDVDTLVCSGLGAPPSEVIIRTAERRGCDLIVMATHGRGGPGRWIYGSVAEEVLRRSRLPVLLVPATCDSIWNAGAGLRILLPLDGSAPAEQALGPMLASIGMLASHLILLRVLPPPSAEAGVNLLEDRAAELHEAQQYLERITGLLRQSYLQITLRIEAGSPGRVIANIAREEAIDLIVMATHGRSGLGRLVLGSVATETMHRAVTPVLLLRPSALGRPAVPSRRGEPEEITSSGARPTFVVAMDLSDKADAAIAPSVRLARASNARIVLLNVFWPPVNTGHVVADTQAERMEYVQAERRRYLEEKAACFGDVDVTTRVEVQAHGEEVDECIARVASELNADLVVVVSKHVIGAAGVLLGSFAQGILRLSPCPVLIVRPTDDGRKLRSGSAG